MEIQASRQRNPLSSLRRLGTVGGTTTFALAVVLAGMLLVAAALTLTVILSFAGVLRQGLVLDQDNTGVRGLNGGAVRLVGLGI